MERQLDGLFEVVFFVGDEHVFEFMGGGLHFFLIERSRILEADFNQFIVKVVDILLTLLPSLYYMFLLEPHLGVVLYHDVKLLLTNMKTSI